MQKDFAYRLCPLSAQQLGAGDQMNCAACGGTPSAGHGAAARSAPCGRATACRQSAPLTPAVRGQQVASEFDAAPQGPVRGRRRERWARCPARAAAGRGGNANQYQSAMALLKNAHYAEASAAFRGFADANPQDIDLAPQAVYWVGNIAYIQQDYSTAARSFAEVIKKYPKSTRAPDAMLKLGQSFMGMGQKSEGCTTLGLLKTKYPDAASQTLGQAASLAKDRLQQIAWRRGSLRRIGRRRRPRGGCLRRRRLHRLDASAGARTATRRSCCTSIMACATCPRAMQAGRALGQGGRAESACAEMARRQTEIGLEAAAREARYRLMGAWLTKNSIATLLVGAHARRPGRDFPAAAGARQRAGRAGGDAAAGALAGAGFAALRVRASAAGLRPR